MASIRGRAEVQGLTAESRRLLLNIVAFLFPSAVAPGGSNSVVIPSWSCCSFGIASVVHVSGTRLRRLSNLAFRTASAALSGSHGPAADPGLCIERPELPGDGVLGPWLLLRATGGPKWPGWGGKGVKKADGPAAGLLGALRENPCPAIPIADGPTQNCPSSSPGPAERARAARAGLDEYVRA